MNSVTLNDGTFIYNEDTAKEYLKSLGVDDVQGFIYMLAPAQERYDNGELVDPNVGDNYELFYSQLSCEVRSAYEEVCELCNKLASGKGGTKVQYADRIRRAFFENIEDL